MWLYDSSVKCRLFYGADAVFTNAAFSEYFQTQALCLLRCTTVLAPHSALVETK